MFVQMYKRWSRYRMLLELSQVFVGEERML